MNRFIVRVSLERISQPARAATLRLGQVTGRQGFQRLQASGQNQGSGPQQKSLIPLVTAGANLRQLKLNGLQPEQDGSVSISLQSQSFDQSLRWMVDLETNNHLLIDRISVDRTENVGLVNIQLRVQ